MRGTEGWLRAHSRHGGWLPGSPREEAGQGWAAQVMGSDRMKALSRGTDLRLQWQDLDIVWEPLDGPVILHWRDDKARRLTTWVSLKEGRASSRPGTGPDTGNG